MSESGVGASGDWVYGCVFCKTGREKAVAERLMDECKAMRALPVTQVKRRTIKGKTGTVTGTLFPGYVFFEVPDKSLPNVSFAVDGVLSVLKSGENGWRLHGEDEAFARWLFNHDGVIGLSKAYREGDRVHILEGPLKDFEGKIIRIDRRNKSGQVELVVSGRAVKIWLGFELVDSLDP